MPFSGHTLDDGRPCSISVNCALSKVVAGDKECCFSTVDLEFVKKIRGIDVWTIIESQSNVSCNSAVIDTSTPIRDSANLWPINSSS